MQIRCALIAIAALAGAAQAQYFSEGFDPPAAPIVTTGLPAGWTSVNNSVNQLGTNKDWNWRNDGALAPFLPHGGTGYAFANFNAVAGNNTISLYMISPLVTFNNGDTISFWTRTVSSPAFPDRMRLMYNKTGTTLPADFQANPSLVDVNLGLTTAGYPNTWTQFTGTITGLSGPTAGRFAFWYDVPGGGPSGANSDFIGVDDVTFAPTPSSLALLGLGGLVAGRRRR